MEVIAKMQNSLSIENYSMNIWGKVFNNGPSKVCGRQPLKTSSIVEYFAPYNFYMTVISNEIATQKTLS